jgi:quercetin dioxygenase-like cupin family protein
MRKLPGLMMSWAAVAGLAGVNAASATPPTGVFNSTEYGRAQQVADANVAVASGRDVVSSTYTLASGADTGWRTGPGNTVVAVTKGVLAVQRAEGCTSHDLGAGNTLVLTPGQFRLHNAGKDPVELLAAFTDLPAGGPAPLVDGPSDPAPACAGFTGAAAAPTGVSAPNAFRGTVPASAARQGPAHQGHADAKDPYAPTVLPVEAGKDAFMTTLSLQPGFSSGWFVHTDHLAILTKGTWAFYEGHDGTCHKVEEYRAGEAWAHGPHPHMGVVEGNEPAEITLFGFNLKHGEPLPFLGSNLDHFDFSTPPQCDRLR